MKNKTEERVRDWYTLEYGPDGAEAIPEEYTWNALFGAIMSGQGRLPIRDPQTQERCIRELSRVLRVDPARLRDMIQRRRR